MDEAVGMSSSIESIERLVHFEQLGGSRTVGRRDDVRGGTQGSLQDVVRTSLSCHGSWCPLASKATKQHASTVLPQFSQLLGYHRPGRVAARVAKH